MDRERSIDSLMLSADLANGSKHLTLDKFVMRGARVEGEIAVDLADGSEDESGTAEVSYTYKVVDASGKSYEALGLARQALKDWEAIISNNGGVVFLSSRVAPVSHGRSNGGI